MRTEQLRFGTLALELLLVDELERYVDRNALLRDSGAAEPPYWAHLWTASRALAKHIAERNDWTGLRVADVGCGLGLLGVLAALKGAEVVAMDVAAEAVAMTRANAALNGCRVSVRQADLRQVVGETFDRCLAADVTYDPALQEALAEFLARHLAADGIAWCAESVRTRDAGFQRACEARGLRVTETEMIEIEEERPVAVRLSEIARG